MQVLSINWFQRQPNGNDEVIGFSDFFFLKYLTCDWIADLFGFEVRLILGYTGRTELFCLCLIVWGIEGLKCDWRPQFHFQFHFLVELTFDQIGIFLIQQKNKFEMKPMVLNAMKFEF